MRGTTKMGCLGDDSAGVSDWVADRDALHGLASEGDMMNPFYREEHDAGAMPFGITRW
jgi:hypothetical protein